MWALTAMSRVIVLHSAGAWSRASVACQVPAAGAARALARTLEEHDATAARVERAYARAQEFRIGPYLDAQERFVTDALAALRGR